MGTQGKLAHEQGASLVEFALVAPVLILLIFGAFEYGMFFKDYLTVSSAFVKLPSNYSAVYGTRTWWKIRYTTTSGRVTDRTTWSVSILGNPVHLVAEK